MNILGFYANTKMLEREEVFRHFFCSLSKQRQQKIEAMKTAGGRRSSLGAWTLADYGLQSLYGLREREISIGYGAHGKPYVQNEPDIHFNLSHSGDYVLAVFAPAEIGCDIQQIAKAARSERIAARFFTEEEQRAIAAGMDFYRIWARKESYIKYTGDGMAHDLRIFDAVTDDESMTGECKNPAAGDGSLEFMYRGCEGAERFQKKLYFAEYSLPGYALAVCYENHEALPVVWREVCMSELYF